MLDELVLFSHPRKRIDRCGYSATDIMVAAAGDPVAQSPFDVLFCHFGICTLLIHQKCTGGRIVAETKALDSVLALVALGTVFSGPLPFLCLGLKLCLHTLLHLPTIFCLPVSVCLSV